MSEEQVNQQITENSEVIIKKPKKKRHAWWRILVAVLVVILIPVGLVYGLLFDPNSKAVQYDETFDVKKFGSNVIIDGFSYTKDEKVFAIRLSELELNSLLHSALGQMPDVAKQFVPAAYCEIDSDNNIYDFYVEGVVPMFKTRACLSTSLEDCGDYFKFVIKDVTVGRVGGLQWVIKKYVPANAFDEYFLKTGLSFQFDMENLCIKYNKSDMMADMTKMMGGISSDNLFVTMFDEFLSMNLIQVGSGKSDTEKYLGLGVNLSPLAENENYVKEDETVLHKAITSLLDKSYIKEEIIGDNESIVDSTSFSNAVQEHIDNLPEMQMVKAAYGTTYLQESASTKVDDGGPFKAEAHIDYVDPLESYVDGGTRVTVEQLNNFLASTGIIGKTTGFYNKDSKKFAYVTINDMYANMYEGHLDFVVTLCLNGLDIYIILPTTVQGGTGDVNYKVVLEIGELMLGTMKVTTHALQSQLMADYLVGALSTGDGLLEISDDCRTITLNFETAYKQGMAQFPELATYTNVTKFGAKIYGDDKDDDDAYIGMEFKVNLPNP